LGRTPDGADVPPGGILVNTAPGASGAPGPPGNPGSVGRGAAPDVRPPAPVIPGSLGILGGTFDPVHLGHLAIAEEVREALGLERVLFVPAARPPHKPGLPVTDPAHRLAMVELAVADNPAFGVSAVEIERPGPSFAVDTLERFHAEARAAGRRPDLVFILSGEALRDLPAWRAPARILDLSRLAVVPRQGFQTPPSSWLAEHFPGREPRVLFLAGPLLAISGSAIRARAAAGRSLRYLVPDAVGRYIADHALYTTAQWRNDYS
jgi:nicotinate-nucleotide adenylyltransferase